MRDCSAASRKRSALKRSSRPPFVASSGYQTGPYALLCGMRRGYLSGFRKRKQERKGVAKKKIVDKEKTERRRRSAQRRIRRSCRFAPEACP